MDSFTQGVLGDGFESLIAAVSPSRPPFSLQFSAEQTEPLSLYFCAMLGCLALNFPGAADAFFNVDSQHQ